MLEFGEEKERYLVVVFLQTQVIIMKQCAVQALEKVENPCASFVSGQNVIWNKVLLQ